MKKPESVDAYIADEEKWQEELVHLRTLILATGLDEQIKWLFPCYTYQNKNIVGLASFKDYFGLWFYQGAILRDADNKLVNAQEGKTQAMRQWRMYNKSEIDHELITSYIHEAIENEKAGKRVVIVKKQVVESPEFMEALQQDHALMAAFEALTPGRQKDYHEHINSAKRDATKQSRISKSIPIIMQGLGLSDKYKK
jgi:uncharacterized protein YdeI (YjbR/CyaY-like superfamily)